MSSYNAQIIIGSPHPNSGGIIPDKLIYLSENGKPALILKEGEGREKVWIPTLENTLEDALLMIASFVIKDEEVLRAISSIKDVVREDYLEMYETFSEEKLQELYATNRKALGQYSDLMIVVSVLEGSLFRNQLSVLNEYDINMEVCISVYSRYYSDWSDQVVVNGSLDIDLPG